MRVMIVGSGYVGLVTSACLADLGHQVINIDLDAHKIAALKNNQIPIYEPGLEDLVQKGQKTGCLKFSTDLAEGLINADIVVLAVGTPTHEHDGSADLSYVFEAVKQIKALLKQPVVLVMKSTVPVGTGRKVRQMLQDKNCEVVSNPEFLREGSAIKDFMQPDRIILGVTSERARVVMSELYQVFSVPVLFTDLETAELIKYASNAFLATKIAYINQMADLCEKTGANIQELAQGMGLDSRIGDKFLNAGPGYGGSCFPKDTLALSKTAHDFESSMTIVDAVIEANHIRVEHMAQRVQEIFETHGGTAGKTLAVLGVTFKPNTDDMREAPSQVILPILEQAGMKLCIYDPSGSEFDSPYDALENADGVLILTEWDEFKQLDLKRVSKLLKTPLMIDFRNIFDPENMKNFEYHSIGRNLIFK